MRKAERQKSELRSELQRRLDSPDGHRQRSKEDEAWHKRADALCQNGRAEILKAEQARVAPPYTCPPPCVPSALAPQTHGTARAS